jgi:hypothetical protein
MTAPPAARPLVKPSVRRDEKKGRASEGGGVVRVFSEYGYFITCLNPSRDSEQIRHLLDAPNAVPVLKHGGKLVAIKLLSFGDDRGHAGERHGRSTITTERVRNDYGVYVGSDRNLKHKSESVNHGCPEVGRCLPLRGLFEDQQSTEQRIRHNERGDTNEK